MPENPSFAETQRGWMKGGGKKVLNIHFKCNARCGMDMWNGYFIYFDMITKKEIKSLGCKLPINWGIVLDYQEIGGRYILLD